MKTETVYVWVARKRCASDQIVYRLDDLTPDEIAQIEGALADTRRAGDGENEADGMEDGTK